MTDERTVSLIAALEKEKRGYQLRLDDTDDSEKAAVLKDRIKAVDAEIGRFSPKKKPAAKKK